MFEELKDALDLELFFETLGAKKFKLNSRGYQMRCMHSNHRDRGPSMHYRTDSHKFKCYGCGFNGDILDIVMHIKNLKFRRALSWIREFAGWSANTTTKQLIAILERRDKVLGDNNGTNDYTPPCCFA